MDRFADSKAGTRESPISENERESNFYEYREKIQPAFLKTNVKVEGAKDGEK